MSRTDYYARMQPIKSLMRKLSPSDGVLLRFMRAIAIIAATGIAAIAAAQDDTASAVLTPQFASWREQPDFRVELNGTEEYGTRSEAFQIVAYHHTEDGKQQLEIVERRQTQAGMVETGRIVADGKWLWRFDYGRQEFTVAPYRTEEGLADERVENTMLTLADVVVRKDATWALRLVREVYGGPFAQYRSWMSPSLLDLEEADPYYKLGVNPVRRGLRWILNSDDPTKVDAAAYFETGTARNLQRRTSWTMTFQAGWRPDDIPTFAPLPPAEVRGWRSVPWARQAAPTN